MRSHHACSLRYTGVLHRSSTGGVVVSSACPLQNVGPNPTKDDAMKTIEIEQLATICGGTSAFDHCVAGVEKKARNFSQDGQLNLGGARKLISSVQRNGFHRCERDGLRNVLDDHPMTGPANKKIGGFLNAVD
jgi:hypothetical protein